MGNSRSTAPLALLRACPASILRALPWASLLATAWLGCGGDGESKGSSGDRSGQCGAICEKRENCVDIDESDCRDTCENLQAFDPEYYTASAACYEDSTCSELTDLEDCVTDALRQKEPSKAQSDFCAAYAAKANDCAEVDEDDVADDCTDDFGKLAAVDYLDDLEKCMSKGCPDVAKCILDVADDYNVDGSDSSGLTFYPAWPSDWSDDEQGDPDGGPVTGDGDGDGAATCDSCLASVCSSEVASCNVNASCGVLADCVTSCGDEGCVDQCISQYPEGAEALGGVTSCASERCPVCAE